MEMEYQLLKKLNKKINLHEIKDELKRKCF